MREGRVAVIYWFDGIHLMAPTEAELHQVAASVGLKPEWFQAHPRHPHYDVWGAPAKRLRVNCTPREMIRRASEQ